VALRAQVFARDGYYLCELGEGRGTGPGQFEGVCSVAITPDAILYASDWKNHRIQVEIGLASLSCCIQSIHSQPALLPLQTFRAALFPQEAQSASSEEGTVAAKKPQFLTVTTTEGGHTPRAAPTQPAPTPVPSATAPTPRSASPVGDHDYLPLLAALATRSLHGRPWEYHTLA
jgi:hypothetical protein